jgi:hypothetical protein|tara:strand:- start:2033 stop:2206 length:174 start_codon:yes stop_codon:yes gene_type:complete
MKDFDFTPQPKKKKPAYKKSKFYKCTNKKCRALIAEKLHPQYQTCPFCGKTEWIKLA